MKRASQGSPNPILRWIDTFNPEISTTSHALVQSRLLTTFSLSVLFWIPLLSAVLYSISAPWTALAIGVCGESIAAALIVQRTLGVAPAGHVAATSAFATILSASLLNGGPALNTHMVLAVVPVVAVSVSGIRAALGWATLVLATTVALYAAALSGIRFPMDIPLAYHWYFQLAASCAFVTTLLAFVVMSEHTRARLTSALSTREADLRGILETARDGLLVLDADGRVRRVNPAAERLFGLESHALLRCSIAELFPGGLSLAHATTHTNVRSRRADDTFFPSDVTLGGLSTSDGERYVALVRDVSERNETERALAEARDRAIQASRTKSTFLANMSHELRTPLNAILGYAELIQEELSPEHGGSAHHDAQRIVNAGRHLTSLISDVLDLSKIEAGKLTLEHAPVAVDHLLNTVLTTIVPLLEANANQLECDRPSSLGTVMTDALRLRQVLFNLLSNAAKFTQGGQITLRTRRLPRVGPGELVIEIEDTGVGMRPEQLERVFEQFVQADASTTRRFGGTGLGLAISQRIVEKMGGTLSVRSQLGVGTTFTLTIPTAPPPTQRPGATARLALVIGGAEVAGLVAALRSADLPVSVAPSAGEGLTLVAGLRPRVVVVALGSGAGGWSVLEQLQQAPAPQGVHLVALAGPSDRVHAPAAIRICEDEARVVAVVTALLAGAARHVLVIEEDPELRSGLAGALSRAGWSVDEASDVVQGLEALAVHAPDAVVLSLDLPGRDSAALVQHLRSHPTCGDVPLLATSHTPGEAPGEAPPPGLERVLPKDDQLQTRVLDELISALPPAGGAGAEPVEPQLSQGRPARTPLSST